MKTILKLTAVVAVISIGVIGVTYGALAGIGAFCLLGLTFSPFARSAFAAVDIKPSTVFGDGYVNDATAHTITMNTEDAPSDQTLAKLTDAGADPTTGDARKIYFALCEQAYNWFNNLPKADRPKKLNITRAVNIARDGTVTNSYTLRFTLTPPGGDYEIPAES